MMTNFEIEGLDHVAIRVADMEISAQWYENVLGLKRYKLEKWGEFPIFLLSGKSGIALFPANLEDPEVSPSTLNIKIDHFAFNVTNENFDKARARYEELGMKFQFKDHYYFHSIYTNDPDGHIVELTTIRVKEDDFYE